MKHIVIDGQTFPLKDDHYYVAVGHQGFVYSFPKRPNKEGEYWYSPLRDPPGEVIGHLGYTVDDWENRLYALPQKEHSVTPE